MSNQKPPKKKVVVTKKPKASATNKVEIETGNKKTKTKVKATTSKATVRKKRTTKSKTKSNPDNAVMIFSKEQLYIMLGGFLVVVLGLVMMSGGAMDDPNEWDANKIYSFRRLTLAPFLILLGMGIEVYALFRKSK